MLIHFVCRGNTYRSRLAETYLNSKQSPNFTAISSGIHADYNDCGPINWYAQRIIQLNHLISFEKFVWEKTTKELLESADYVVFMNTDIYDYCAKELGYNKANFVVWSIKNIGKENSNWEHSSQDEKIKITEETFDDIKRKVEVLIGNIASTT